MYESLVRLVQSLLVLWYFGASSRPPDWSFLESGYLNQSGTVSKLLSEAERTPRYALNYCKCRAKFRVVITSGSRFQMGVSFFWVIQTSERVNLTATQPVLCQSTKTKAWSGTGVLECHASSWHKQFPNSMACQVCLIGLALRWDGFSDGVDKIWKCTNKGKPKLWIDGYVWWRRCWQWIYRSLIRQTEQKRKNNEKMTV